MGAATVGAVGASSWGLVRPTVNEVGAEFIQTPYLGARVLPGSPAPRPLPLVPIKADADGFLHGVPGHLDWLRYCGNERNPQLHQVVGGDESLRYHVPDDKIHAIVQKGDDPAETWWFIDRIGHRVHVDDLADLPYDSGATVRWRSEDARPEHTLILILLKLDPASLDPTIMERFGVPEAGLLAYSGTCTHFCCVPGYKESPDAKIKGHWDHLFCTCHGSAFDPYGVEEASFRLRR